MSAPSIPKIDTSSLGSPVTLLSSQKSLHSSSPNSRFTPSNNNNNNFDAPQVTPRSAPWRNEKDRQDAKRMIPYLAAALLFPLSASNLYFALYYHKDGDEGHDQHRYDALFHLGYFVFFATSLGLIADRFPGEFMLIAVFLIGLFNELFDVGMNKAAYAAVMNGFGWIFIAALLGFISGTFCKAKDIIDGRYRKEYSFTERLYLMVPYVVGVWVGHIVLAGWSGLWTVFSSIFFCEAVVGYGVLALKLLRQHGFGIQGDLLSVFRTLANASFGKVFFFGGIFSLIFFYLLAPSWWDLSQRLPHTVLSSVCIITEVATYDWVA